MITNKNYFVDLASLADKKLTHDFAEEMNFDVKAMGNKSTWDRILLNLLKLPSLMISASSISNKRILPANLVELCDRLKILLQDKQAEKKWVLINEEKFVIFYKFLEYNCSTKNNINKFN